MVKKSYTNYNLIIRYDLTKRERFQRKHLLLFYSLEPYYIENLSYMGILKERVVTVNNAIKWIELLQ